MEAKMEGIHLRQEKPDSLEKIKKIFDEFSCDYRGNLAIWSGKLKSLLSARAKPDCILIFNKVETALRFAPRFRDPLLFGRLFQGWMDIEGDIYSVLELKDYLKSLTLSGFEKISFWLATHSLNNTWKDRVKATHHGYGLKRPAMPKHNKDMNRRSNSFPTMTFPTSLQALAG